MVRILRFLLAALLLTGFGGLQAREPSMLDAEIGVDIDFVDSSGYGSFLRYSAGKLRFDGVTDGLQLSRAWFDNRYRLAETVTATLVGEAYDDRLGATVDITEAYIAWRPLTMKPTRYRVKLGAFYPRISLENVERGWSSPYTITPSAINTWIGEEFRSFGAEVGMTRRPQAFEGRHRFSLHAAVFMANDPAGTLLSWKGWSLHDRQTRFGDEVPLPPVPQIQPGMPFDLQDPFVAPFREIDDAVGYYVTGEWSVDRRLILRLTHYDNRADPMAYEDGQFGWYTEFDAAGVKLALPAEIGLVAQWIQGSTVWGPVINGAHVVDAGFRSHFALLTRQFGKHRLSLRHDRFHVSDRDGFPMDDNSEAGEAVTAAYQFSWTETIRVAAEWLAITSHRPAWEYFGFDRQNTETQLRLQVRMRFRL